MPTPSRFQYRGMSAWRPPSTIVGLLACFIFTARVEFAVSADLTNCRKALGMHSGAIPDHVIVASSSYDSASVGPSNARIRTERNGGAWCPKPQISRNVYEWIQIDLQELKVVTQVETQGRFGNGQGQEYAEAYMLEYQRTEDGRWIRFHDRKGSEVFLGNSNTYIAEPRDINPPIIARRIRIIPHSNHPRTVCMRLELYGCQWRDGVLSYSMPQGDRRGNELDLFDFTYDGEVRADNYLVGGLGQLTDGVEGHSNFRQDLDGWGRKGYEWVGWKNDSTDRPLTPTAMPGTQLQQQQLQSTVEIVFEFERVRNFTTVRFHVNNMFSKEVRVFRRAVLYFSVGGVTYRQQPVVYDYMRDTLIDFARNVIINVPNRIGRFLKVELYFDARWIMLSEVRFESELATGNYTEEPLTPGHTPSSSIYELSDGRIPTGSNSTSSSSGNGAEVEAAGGSTRDPVSSSMDDRVVGIVAGTLAAVGLLLAGVVIFCVVCRRRRFSAAKKSSASKVPAVRPNYAMAIPGRIGNDVILSGRKTGNGSGGNAYSNSSAYGAVVTSLLQQQQQQQQFAGVEDGYDEDDIIKVAPLGVMGENGTGAYDPYNQPNDIMGLQPRRPLPDVPRVPVDLAGYLSDTNTSTYAVPEQLFSTANSAFSFSRTAPFSYAPAAASGLQTLPHPVYRSQQDVNAPAVSVRPTPLQPGGTMLHHGGGSREVFSLLHSGDDSGVYSALPGTPSYGGGIDVDTVQLSEIPRDGLSFVEKIGEGLFGEVHLCEVASKLQTDEVMAGRNTGLKPSLVAVKVLNQDASNKARADFFSEVKMMACLKDPNIVSLLGICSRDDPLCIVLEYMKHGDLHQFLQVHVAAESSLIRNGSGPSQPKALSYGCLIYMATQIASGMKYLETLNMVHRDLATRNCLVGHKYGIKISDFGMSRSLYSADYYRVEGKALLPIRWMAWESILMGKFSTKSDVWSFAVTLWEILTFARERPLESLTDEQVIQNCGYYYQGEVENQQVLPQPANCPREIYDLMLECWNPDTVQRPAFREVHMFLQRKNMGYNPADERRTPSRNTTPYV